MFQDRGYFRVSWRANGRKHTRAFKSRDEAALFELELKTGRITPMPADQLTFAAWAARWLEGHCKTRKHESQWGKDRDVVERFLTPSFGHKRLAHVQKRDLLELVARLRVEPSPRTGKPLAPKSVNLIVTLAKTIMATAVDHDLVAKSPFAGVRLLPVPERPMAFWTPEERERFLAAAAAVDPEFAGVVAVACHTGLRLGELTALTRADLDFGRGKILVRATFSHVLKKRFEVTKGRTVAEVPMNQAVREALADRQGLAPTTPVFRGALLADACHRLQRLCRRVGVTPLRFHDLRHTFASCLAMAGVDLMTIQRLMRHRSYQMTLRYAHLHPEHLRGVTEVLCRAAGGSQMAHPILRVVKSGGPRGT